MPAPAASPLPPSAPEATAERTSHVPPAALILAAAIATIVTTLTATATLAADAPAAFDPAAIDWQRTNPDGTRFALLEGVRDRPGVAFTYAFFIPAGVWDGPHSHAATARVFVARGSLRLGYGDRLDRAAARAYLAGSVLVVPAGAQHFDGASEDTIIIGTAVGPWSTDYVDPAAKVSAGTPH